MNLNEIQIGDVLWMWYANGHEAGDNIVFYRVVRVNRNTVTVENPRGKRKRVLPGEFSGTVKPHEWSPWNLEGQS